MKKRASHNLLKELNVLVENFPDHGSDEYSQRVSEIINDLQNVKSTLRSGPNRKTNRKESASLQRAIEALRYLGRKSDKVLQARKEESEKKQLAEFTALTLGRWNTSAGVACDSTGVIKKLTGNERLAQNIDTFIHGFIPYYICDAADATLGWFMERLVNPMKHADAAIVYYINAYNEDISLNIKMSDHIECSTLAKNLKEALDNAENTSPSTFITRAFNTPSSWQVDLEKRKSILKDPTFLSHLDKADAQMQKELEDVTKGKFLALDGNVLFGGNVTDAELKADYRSQLMHNIAQSILEKVPCNIVISGASYINMSPETEEDMITDTIVDELDNEDE